MKLFRFLKPISLSIALLFPVLISFALFAPRSTSAASYTWDGGGATSSWSECTNWSTDVCPIAGDSVTFNATSTKDSVVDAAWTASGGSITGITLAAGYTGTLSLERSLTVSGTLSVASGTFTAGAQSADLNIVTISGGVFNASTGTMTISANFTHTAGGTFNHNSGTVVIDGPSGATWDVATTEEFHNLTFNSPSASFATTIASGDTLNVNGTLTLTDGFFATGTIAAKGSTVSIGSAFGTGTNASGTLLINGSGAQTVTIAPQTDTTFEIADQFTLNNASATVTGTGASGRLGFDKVTLTAGTFTTTGYDLTMNEALTINGGTLTLDSTTTTVGGTFLQSSGTLNGGSGAVDFNGAVTISGGTFNASTGTMNMSGSFTHTAGGTFNHQNGSIIIDSASGILWDVAVTEELYNLTVNHSNNSFPITIASGDTLNVNGALVLTDGYIITGTLAAKGGVSVGAGYGTGTNASGTLLINGSGAQSVTIAPQTDSTFEIADQFTLNNASATVTGTGTAGRIGFDKITVTLGTFNMDGYNTTAQEAVTVNGGIMSFGSGTHTLASTLALSSGTIHGGSGSLAANSTVTISGGTFNGDTVTSTFSGVFTLSGGTFNASTGTMTYASDWTHTAGGTFNHLGGTTQFTGANNSTINVASTEEFGAIILNKNNGINLVISSGDTITASGTLTLTEGRWTTGTLAAQGDVNVGANFDNTSVAASFIFSGGNVQTLTMGVLTKFSTGDVYINKSGGQVNLGGTWTMDSSNNDLIVQEGTLDLNGYNLTVTGAGTETFIIEDGGNLQLQGGETITGDSASYPQLNSGSTVTYDGTSGPYTMKNYTYHHLVIAGGANSVFTQAANESYGGNVTITSGILSQGGFTTTVTGAFSNLGTLRRLQAETFTGTMDVDSGTVEYVGDGDGSVESVTVTDFGGTDYYNLKINDVNATKDTFTIGGGLVVAGELSVPSSEFIQGANTVAASDLVINGGTYTGSGSTLDVGDDVTLSSGTFTAPSGSLLIGGDITKSGGTFTHNSGAVTFDSGLSHTVTGSFTWNDFALADDSDNATDASLTVEAGSTQTFEGDVVFDGLDTTDRVNILSSSTGNEATFAFAGASTFTGDYLDVKDNAVTDSSSGTSVPLNPSNSVENGNTTNWFTDGGFTVSVVSGNTTEAGGTATFTVVLTAQPVADVTIPLSSSDTSEGTVSPASLTFTSVNWATPQTVTITGQNDFLDDGNIEYTIVIGAVTSGDWGYNGLNPDDRTLSNVDNDTSGMTVSAISGDTEEDGTTATFTVVLTAQPTGNVVVLSESSNEAEGIVTSGAMLTFTSVNWATPQTVTVTGQDDSGSDGDIAYTIAVTIDTAATADALYDAVAAAEVDVVNLDDDQGGGRYNPPIIFPTVYLLNPNSAGIYEVGDRIVWYWDASSSLAPLTLAVSEHDQDDWDTLHSTSATTGTWTWTIPSSYASQVLDVRLSGYTTDGELVADEVSSWVRVLAAGEELVEDGDVEEEETDPETEAELLCPLSQGSYVKLSWLPTVYFIDANCTRRPFLDAVSYFTYQDDFSGVQLVETSVLQQTGLGKPMSPNPGRVLVKVQSVPAVYVVEPVEGLDRIATLRWIPTEDVARSVIGESWNKYIIDLPPTLFTHFTFGDDVEENEVVDREDLMVPRY